jgi:hypothetical protein
MAIPMNVAEVTNIAKFVPGRLAASGSRLGTGTGYSDNDAYVANLPTQMPFGWIGYEDVDTNARPADVTKAYTNGDETRVYMGGGFGIYASLFTYQAVKQGDLLCNWFNGQLAGPVAPAPGGIFLAVPYATAAAVVSTAIIVPVGCMVGHHSYVEPSTALASTIEVGFENATESGDLDGILNAISINATNIPVASSAFGTGAAAETIGELLAGGEEGSSSTYTYGLLYPGYVVASPGSMNTLGRTVVYTPGSASACAGRIWLHLVHPHLRVVAKAMESVTTTSSASSIRCLSMI